MEQAVAAQRSGEVGGERTDPGLLAVKKLIAAFLREGGRGELARAVEQAMLRLATAPGRERADYLLSLCGEPEIATPSGHPGIRRAAVRALIAFGFPYALEVPPEVIDLARPRRSIWPRVRNGIALLISAPAWLFSVVAGLALALEGLGAGGIAAAATMLLVAIPHVAWGVGTLGLLTAPLGSQRVRRARTLLLGGAVVSGGLLALGQPSLAILGVPGLLAWAVSISGTDAPAG